MVVIFGVSVTVQSSLPAPGVICHRNPAVWCESLMQQPIVRCRTSSDHFCPPGRSHSWTYVAAMCLSASVLRDLKCFPRQQVAKLWGSESESSCVQTEEEGEGRGGGRRRRRGEEQCALPGRPRLESLCSGHKYYDQFNHQLNRTRPSAAENQVTVWVCAICSANTVQMMQTCMRWQSQKTLPGFFLFHIGLCDFFFFFSFLTKRDSLWSSKSIPLLPAVSWLENIKCRSRLLGLLSSWNLTVLFANVGPSSARSQESPLETHYMIVSGLDFLKLG